MSDNSNCIEKNKNIIRERLFTDNEEKEKAEEENDIHKNLIFNLEYQKINNLGDGKSNVTLELKKLIDYVRERYYYRDIKGNRIIPKGELLPTPFQKLKKINEEIKFYYQNKLNRKNSPLIIKNYKNKYLKNNYNYKTYNSLSGISQRKTKNFLPKKCNKNFQGINLSKGINNYKAPNKSNLMLSINNNIKELNKNIKSNNICFSETFNVDKTKYFHDSQFNQINFWKTKMLYPQILNRNNDNEKKNSIYNNYMTEYKKSNNEINIKNIMNDFNINKNNINNSNRNSVNNKQHKLKCLSNREFSKHLNKYNLIQFNMNQLIKRDQSHKDKIILNMRKGPKIFNNNRKNVENKIINVNIDEDKNKI